MEENIGAFEEKKRKKGGKRLMKPEKAVRASAESCGETPPRVPRETSGKAGKVIAIVAAVLAAAYLGFGAWVSAGQCIYPNVMLGEVNYGGMSEQQVAEQLRKSATAAIVATHSPSSPAPFCPSAPPAAGVWRSM